MECQVEWMLFPVFLKDQFSDHFFFILMVDIGDTIVKAALGSFAEDTHVWQAIRSLLNANKLQKELLKVYTWADINNMKFNGDKF